ncbi:UDP-galactose transporter [Ostreococcus tauri]|uniref:UDP-galactose transporter n=1 Tax=Ostreococcus tauri TaxID=70448 RepID=Q00UH0_OSTTA|nr:UDP-galactose transporter [Ostreococcus tauri]CAL58079.1 UDP-galactose transporter [Ostreococcus tauri]|eukprot:XP_003083530.1 UDP-galactose transporter [Ostreococcus tauri]
MGPSGAAPRARALQVWTLLLLTAQNTALVLVTKMSYRDGGAAPYVASTVIACSEMAKLLASGGLVLALDGEREFWSAVREIPSSAFRLALPSVLYVVQNNLLFEGIRLLSPTVYMVCSQSKILTSALFAYVLLKTTVTRTQAASLCALVVGMILVQAQDDGSASGGRGDSGTSLRGLVVVFTASMTSGFAGAYLEKMYKQVGVVGVPARSIWVRNMQLACFSVPIAMFTAMNKDGARLATQGFFGGYDGIVILIIALQAIGGLIVAAVMRYASNVLKCFAVSLSICNCAVATTYVLGDGTDGMSAHQMLGIVLVIGATFAYANK